MRSPSAVSGPRVATAHYSSAARSIGCPSTKTQSPCSVTGIAFVTATTRRGARRNLGRPVGPVDEPETSDGIPGGDGIAGLEDRLAHSVLGETTMFPDPVRPGSRRAEGRARPGSDFTLEDADVAEHVVETAPREPMHRCRNPAAAAELGRDHDLALVLGLDRQQAVPLTSM